MTPPTRSLDGDEAEFAALGARVAKGAGWLGAARFAVRILGFVNTIIVARLLAPEDFGLVAIAVTAMQLLQGFSDVGVSQAVIRFRDAGRDDLDTLFTLSAARGVLVAALLAAAAPFAAEFYNDPRVFWVFLGVAAYPLSVGLMNPRFFEFERDLDFSKDFIAATLNKLGGVAVSIAVAVAFRSYWAIILGLVTGGVVQLVLSYRMRPYRPRLSLASFDKVFAFSSWLAGVSFFAALNNKLDALIVARVMNVDDTGAYYMGVQLADMPSSEVAAPVARAIYPGFSSLDQRQDDMRRAYLQGVAALASVSLPASLGFAFVANDLAPLLLGEKWIVAAPVIEILAPVVGLQTLFLSTQYFAMARDKTKYAFFRELLFFVTRTPIFIWAATTHGLVGAAMAAAGCGLFHVGLNMAIYARLTKRHALEPLWAARRSIFGCAAMSVYFLLVRPDLGAIEALPALARTAVDVGAGAAIFAIAQYALWRAEGMPAGVEQAAVNILARRLSR